MNILGLHLHRWTPYKEVPSYRPIPKELIRVCRGCYSSPEETDGYVWVKGKIIVEKKCVDCGEKRKKEMNLYLTVDNQQVRKLSIFHEHY